MVCRGGGVWISRDGLSTYQQITDKRVYPAVEGRFEDPVVWCDSLQYHLIVNDWLGRIAFYQRSKDGIHWVTEQGEAYVPGISFHKDGEVEHWFKYERAKVFQDPDGRAVQMNFAVIDTIKGCDQPGDRHSSKNICVPLNKGLLLSVLNEQPITASTKRIEVKIKAEPGFSPQTDVDIESLRFGSFTEVNFGRGSKPLKTRKEGDDLIVVFSGKGSGIMPDEFAPKLIGRTTNGELLYGYARLPYVDYAPALLSARRPQYNKDQGLLKLKISNFGLSASRPSLVEVCCGGKVIASGDIKPLSPYEEVELALKPAGTATGADSAYEVIIRTDGQEQERVLFRQPAAK